MQTLQQLTTDVFSKYWKSSARLGSLSRGIAYSTVPSNSNALLKHVKMSTAEAKSKDVQHGPIHYPLWFGGSASCFAACVTHPLDLSKSRDLLEAVK